MPSPSLQLDSIIFFFTYHWAIVAWIVVYTHCHETASLYTKLGFAEYTHARFFVAFSILSHYVRHDAWGNAPNPRNQHRKQKSRCLPYLDVGRALVSFPKILRSAAVSFPNTFCYFAK